MQSSRLCLHARICSLLSVQEVRCREHVLLHNTQACMPSVGCIYIQIHLIIHTTTGVEPPAQNPQCLCECGVSLCVHHVARLRAQAHKYMFTYYNIILYVQNHMQAAVHRLCAGRLSGNVSRAHNIEPPRPMMMMVYAAA